MTSLIAPSFGAFLSELGDAREPSTSRFGDVREAPSRKSTPSPRPPVSRDTTEEKYPRWAVTLFVVGFCAAFWAGAIWLGIQIFN